jgi:hypothetical protein
MSKTEGLHLDGRELVRRVVWECLDKSGPHPEIVVSQLNRFERPPQRMSRKSSEGSTKRLMLGVKTGSSLGLSVAPSAAARQSAARFDIFVTIGYDSSAHAFDARKRMGLT